MQILRPFLYLLFLFPKRWVFPSWSAKIFAHSPSGTLLYWRVFLTFSF